MAQEKKGLIARMLEGKEKSEEYARSTLPTNRWQLFWDIFKGNFGKIVKVNLLILLPMIPVLAIILISSLMQQTNGVVYPFGANLGIGYPAAPDMTGVEESLIMQSDLYMFGFIALASLITAIGLSGGMYVVRNMVWTEGIFVANDYWRGVKLNYKNALQTALFFSIVLLLSTFMINMANISLLTVESGFQSALMKISKVFCVILIVLSALMSFWMISLGVNYEQKFFVLLRNSFLMTIGMLPQSVFFAVLALLPFFLLMIGQNLFTMIAVVMIILFGFSYALLVWLDFSQWAFDKFINPKIAGAKVGRGIYNKDGTRSSSGEESAAEKEYRRVLLANGKSDLVSRPIKPIDDSLQVYELPAAFTREDLQKLRESKQNIAEDTAAYAEEHKNDLRYVEYNKQFEEREKALKEADEKSKKKRKPPKMLGE